MDDQKLIDFDPLQDYKKSKLKVHLIFSFCNVVVLIALIQLYSVNLVMFWIAFPFWVLALIAYLGINLILGAGVIATNWDNMDYTGFKKINIDFLKEHELDHYAYLYIPDGVEVKSSKTPAIIGFHGWNSHHREMDRYCLPTARAEKFLYFTMDARGQGNTTGSKNDFEQVNDAIKFIDMIASLPYVDKERIAVVGMSMGAARCAYAAYPHPYVRACVMLSGPYDLYYTRYHLSLIQRILFYMSGCRFPKTDEGLKHFSGINKFKPEGIKLAYTDLPVPNSDRVFLAANEDDPVVTPKNTDFAIERLNLPPENYRIFPKGNHCFESGEYYLSVDIYKFLIKYLKK